MATHVLALESGVTTLETHRLGLTGFTQSNGPITGRTGIYPAGGAANIATVSAMVCSIAPFSAWIDGSNTATQGGYPFTLDATVNLTFDPGNVSTVRHDRIIARVRDDTYDSSGATAGSVEILKGNTTTGVATALPSNSMLLYDVAVPIGASAGGSGIDFSSDVADERAYTSAAGGVTQVNHAISRDYIGSPYEGMLAYRLDTDCLERYDGTQWRPVGIPIVASVANLSLVTDPIEGDMAFVTDDSHLYRYDGSDWFVHDAGHIVSWGYRETSTTSQATDHGVVRLTGIPVYAGRQYKISTGNSQAFTSTNGDFLRYDLKYTTNGSNPTTASAQLPGSATQKSVSNFSSEGLGPIITIYTPATDHTLGLLLVLSRVAGSGNFRAISDSAQRIQIIVEDIGPAVSNTGVAV